MVLVLVVLVSFVSKQVGRIAEVVAVLGRPPLHAFERPSLVDGDVDHSRAGESYDYAVPCGV